LFDSKVKLSDEHKIRLIRVIAAGMFHLHKHNIVHRDLATRNILLTESGQPKISVLSLFVSFSFYLNMLNRLKSTIDTIHVVELIVVFRILDWHEFLRKQTKEK
jgi:serine/threonine protein kinase